jgi:hypothetical protein
VAASARCDDEFGAWARSFNGTISADGTSYTAVSTY